MRGWAKERLKVREETARFKKEMEKLIKERECLKCEKLFVSASPFNRLCARCKESVK